MTLFILGILVGVVVTKIFTLVWLKAQIMQAFRGYDGMKRSRK